MRPYIILILLVIIAFANSLQNSFVWEYAQYIKNLYLDFSMREMPSIFITSVWKFAGVKNANQDYYRPLSFLFFILNYKIWGTNPIGFQLARIMFHLISTIVLYRTGLLLFDVENNILLFPNKKEGRGKWDDGWLGRFPYRKMVSLTAASIFAVHPVNSESVAWGADVFVGFFIILSLYFFLREKQYLSLLTFSLALLSKEIAVILPFALVILAVHKKGLKKGIISIIPYIMLVGIFLVIRAMLVDTFLGIKADQPIFVQIFTMAAATLDYIRLLIIPYPLSPYYPERWYTSVFDPKVIFAMVVLMLILLFAFKIRKDKVMFFLLVFVFLMLAPVIFKVNSFQIKYEHFYIAERFLYVSLMPFSLFVSACAFRLAGDIGGKYLFSGAGLLIAVFTVITISSNRIWKNDLTLFTKITNEFPAAVFAHINLGMAYGDNGIADKSIEQYRIAIKLKPDDPQPYYNLGVIYQSQGLTDRAIEQYRVAIKLDPDDPKTHNNLGNAYSSMGFIDKAIEQFQIAIKLKPDDPKPYYNLGVIYQSQGLIDKAIEQYLIAIRLDPYDPGPYNNLGNAYLAKGFIDRAIEQYRIALGLKTDIPALYVNLGNAYLSKGMIDEAIEQFNFAMKLKPDNPVVHKNLGIAYLRKGLIHKSEEHFRMAETLQKQIK